MEDKELGISIRFLREWKEMTPEEDLKSWALALLLAEYMAKQAALRPQEGTE